MAECACGCGEDAGVYRKRARRGQPRTFIHGHNARGKRRGAPVLDRLNAKIMVVETGCWLWTGTVFHGTGYGAIKVEGKLRLAHRVAYETFRGSIPDDLTLDHLCRVRRCVNPTHLEAVTTAENLRRGSGTKLTSEQVEEIRSSTGETQASLARRFGVSQSHVSHLRSGKRQYWRAEP